MKASRKNIMNTINTRSTERVSLNKVVRRRVQYLHDRAVEVVKKGQHMVTGMGFKVCPKQYKKPYKAPYVQPTFADLGWEI